jgi:hypothetical protein
MIQTLFAKTVSRSILVNVSTAFHNLQNRTATIATIVITSQQTDAKVAMGTFSRLITTCTAMCVYLDASADEARSQMARRSVRSA